MPKAVAVFVEVTGDTRHDWLLVQLVRVAEALRTNNTLAVNVMTGTSIGSLVKRLGCEVKNMERIWISISEIKALIRLYNDTATETGLRTWRLVDALSLVISVRCVTCSGICNKESIDARYDNLDARRNHKVRYWQFYLPELTEYNASNLPVPDNIRATLKLLQAALER